MYPDDMAWVHIIMVNLEESPSEWLVLLHDELDDIFIQALQEQLEDPMATRCVEAHIYALKQGK